MIFIGIDVGKKGAIAIIDGDDTGPNGVQVFSQPLIGNQPDESAMRAYLAFPPGCHIRAMIERTHAMPGQGRTSAHNFGELGGLWRGMMVGCEIPHQRVSAITWQRAILTGEGRKDLKASSIRVAKRLFPGVNLLPTPKCRKDCHGLSDALLIAEYGRRSYMGRS